MVALVARVDRYQRRRSWLGFPLAVIYKFFDDRGPYLAAMVTYYGFVSLFPLLLLFLGALGFFLEANPGLREQLVHSALAGLPVIGPQLQRNITGFSGSGTRLAFSILGALYGGLGAMQAAQAGFNQIYGVPRNEQPNPALSRLRSLGLLLVLGGAVLLSTAAATLVAAADAIAGELGFGVRLLGYLLSFAINVGLFTAAMQLLTARNLHIRQVITGGLIAAAFWAVLQAEGARFLAHWLRHASALYGTFGLVLAALVWIYLQALVLMLSAEINMVASHRLWPRALLTPFTDDVELTEADRRLYTMYAAAHRFKGFETVRVSFSRPPRR
ncbi:YihY/virulence factor BrkB family protein [Dactylosporangium sp. NPDC048998]|uniref:YihY/virulence factor BrkB family protein n=1 Tax=Dactylosporangium sp. NPDC048998 TaxID=3363976 RepID=UPI00371DF362